jgi:GT2 family glycosyltransferase
MEPSLTVIIPTYNRRDRLERLLRALEPELDGHRAEVIVVVDGAADGTVEMLEALCLRYPLRVYTQPNRGPAAARNRAMEAASGDVLLFLDDDVLPAEGLINRHLKVHRREPRAVVLGPMVPPPGTRLAPWLQWEAVTLQKQYDAMAAGCYTPTPRQFYTADASVRREPAMAAGGFDESYTRAEDVEFAYRLADRGLQFYFLPDAAVLHEPDRTFESWLRVAYEYGRHDVRLEREQRRPQVRQAFQEAQQRHPVSRWLARWCVGGPWRRAIVAAGAAAVRYDGPAAPTLLQRWLCSILFNIQYWQGIADAMGLGAQVWDGRKSGSKTPSLAEL